MDKFAVEPLDEHNFPSWSIRIQALLVNKGLGHALLAPPGVAAADGVPPAVSAADSEKALAIILLSVKDHHLQAIQACGHAHAAWQMLQATYRGASEARVLQLRRQLTGLKKDAAESLTRYFGRAEELTADLAAAGQTIGGSELAYAVLSGLPTQYDVAVTVLKMSGQAISLRLLLQQLLPVEQQLISAEAEHSAFAAQNSGISRGTPQPVSAAAGGGWGKCWKCLKPGHRVFECPNPPSPQAKKCGKCGKYGHTADRCRSLGGTGTGARQEVAFAAGDNSTDDRSWLLDSGCSNHMTPDSSKFLTYEVLSKPVFFTFANGEKAQAVGQGEIQLVVNGNVEVRLLNVLHVPAATVNLLSVRKIMTGLGRVEFSANSCKIYKGDQLMIETTEIRAGVFTLTDTSDALEEAYAMAARTAEETAELWHRRFGHLSYRALAQLRFEQMVDGISVTDRAFEAAGREQMCETCIQAKQTRQPFPTSTTESDAPLNLVHMDVCGPMRTQSLGGNRYMATFLDDYSRFSVVVPVSHKSDVAAVVKRTITLLENQSGRQLKAVRTDRGGEYLNATLADYFAGKGVEHQTTTPYTPEQNGKAERLNRTLEERIRAMLLESGLKPELWAEAAVAANFVRNRSPTADSTRTPWERFFGKRPNVGILRVFGARAYVLTPKHQRDGKLAPVSEPGTFVGYAVNSKAYRVLLESTNKVVESRDVVVDERAALKGAPSRSGDSTTGIYLSDDEAPPANAPAAVANGDIPVEAPPPAERTASTGTEEGEMRGAPRPRAREAEDAAGARYPRRARQAPGPWYVANAAAADDMDTPATVEEAMSRPDAALWREAMAEEMSSLLENETW